MKKFLKWVLIVFLVFFVVKNPAGAAVTAQGIASGMADIGMGFGYFLTHLASRSP